MKAKIQMPISGLSHEWAQWSDLPLPTYESSYENEAIPQDSPPSLANSEPSDIVLVPLSDLWDAISNSPYWSLGDTSNQDLFEELQEPLLSNTEMFLTPSVQSCFPTPSDLSPEEAVRDDDFGIKLPEAQMKAVLDWVKEIGAHDVPSLYVLKQHQRHLQDVAGDPTRKVVSPFSNIFYINDIEKAIAKDYANPLMHLMMQDFPEDRGEGMSQVFHGEKLLHELPSLPAVRVNGTIYFVNELLQESSMGYFIPERFFVATPNVALSGTSNVMEGTKELYALGQAIK
ncbi:hypothetical protein PAXRUDRAFT_17787 [Paxillus rubicundulus Ve08.2h10]|uniref:Uncharacterized protein n=1 Tax=Paxillus rubicundulus Ve08.2h10 TaxID=930991 RepID=A0A0D0CP21_9AGAM|nr:hypothetical protein PAXRUDRAFT_17787 [Paxillus rubicundulus Ve08.2h10]